MLALALFAIAMHPTPDALWSDDSRYVRFRFTNMTSNTTWDIHTVTLDTQTGKADDKTVGESNCVFGDDAKAGEAAKQCNAARKQHASDAKKSDEAWTKAHHALASTWNPAWSMSVATNSPATGARVEIAKDASGAKFHVAFPGRPAHDKELDAGLDDNAAVGASWSPSGGWVLCFVQGDQQDAQYALLPGVAWIDLLDAGAGDAKLKTTADALTKVGFSAQRKAKSDAPHAKTEVFYAVGFEADAKQVAAAIGGEAKPLAWATPYELTVAVAK
jgi:hypothetical protein